jgi:hypothetical protein
MSLEHWKNYVISYFFTDVADFSKLKMKLLEKLKDVEDKCLMINTNF